MSIDETVPIQILSKEKIKLYGHTL